MSVQTRGGLIAHNRDAPNNRLDPPLPRLRLLEGFELIADGEPLDVPTSAQRVVAFLALHDRSLLRTFVAGNLWPDASETRALACLRSALWRLHRLGIDLVDASVDRIWLVDRLDVDHRRAEAAARTILEGRCDLSPSELTLVKLGGMLLPDWYDEWVSTERERWLQLRLHALERLSDLLVSAGRFAEAVDVALAAVGVEPLRESAQRALIKVYLAEGNAVNAVRQYERYRRMLVRELHVSPSGLMNELMAGVG